MVGINDGLGSVFRAEGPEAAGRLRKIPSVYNSTGVGRGIRSDVLNEMGIMGVDPQLVRELDQKTGTGDSAFGIIPNEIPSLAALQEELAKVKSMAAPISSSLSNLQASKKVSEKIEAMPDDSDVFAPSALDMMAAPMPNLSINSQGDRVLSQTNSAGDEAKAQDMIVAKRKKQQEEQLLADKNREASLDMPSDPAEQLFSQAMTDYISQARTGVEDELPEVRGIDDLKGEFAKATGIDISGKPDTSQALMAMGLSMMQNRAGKRFNVGKILNAVGEAGEKALPALTAAKAEARNNVIAAGKYALTAQDADEKTRKAAEKDLMNRGKYWVFSKGGKDGEFSNFEKGEFVDLNKAEMNKLITDPKFDEKYSFVDATTRFDILAKRGEGQELGDMWGKKPEAVSLIGGAAKDVPAELQVFGTYANPNYSGKSTSRIKLSEEPQAVINRFLSYQDGIDRSVSKFTNLVDQIDQGVSIPGQAVDKVTGVFRSLGFNVEGLPSNTAEAKRILNNIAIDEATNILKESGKTLSDGDRRLVRERVGQIDFFNADKALIKKQVQEVYDLIVTKSQKNLDTAIGKLESDFGISVRPTTKSGPKDQAEVDEFNKMYGTEFTMETFPKD